MRCCSINGCGGKHEARGWCDKHYARWKRLGDPLALVTAERGTALDPRGYRVFSGEREHVAIAEKALGRPLPRGVVVHHVDEDRTNNASSNLVVCTRAYHMLIHARMRAFAECGNPSWRKCFHCGAYDDLANLYTPPRGGAGYHKACRNKRRADAIKAGTAVPGAHVEQRRSLQIR